MRPDLDINLKSNDFINNYYLKEELVAFCKKYGLQASGSKLELTERIKIYLDTRVKTTQKHEAKTDGIIALDAILGDHFSFSEEKRSFYKRYIGDSFSFNVMFQKWIKENPDKTYQDSIDAYFMLKEIKKQNKTNIEPQFEYNTYIRDFFADNNGYTMKEAIKCWKYKKSIPGTNKYEKTDLEILEKN